MAITLYTHFTNNIALPNTSVYEVITDVLAESVDKYEDKYLNTILGYALNKLLQANINQSSGIYYDLINGAEYTDLTGTVQKWQGFATIGSNPIANYIYYWVIRQNVTTTMDIGVRMANAENMINVSAMNKMMSAWNEMVEFNFRLHEFLYANKTSYTTYIGLKYPPPFYPYFLGYIQPYTNLALYREQQGMFQTINSYGF
jgi:hypothetical protein